MTLVDDVEAGLAALGPLDDRDRAAANVLRLLAARIDDTDGWADKQRDPLAELSPKFLQYCDRFGMTPAARKAAATPPEPARKSPLDELRERRAARQSP